MIWDAIFEVKNIDLGDAWINEVKNDLDTLQKEINSSTWNYIENGRVNNTLAECLGFGMHPQTYGSYPWGQGVTLSMLSKIGVPFNSE